MEALSPSGKKRVAPKRLIVCCDGTWNDAYINNQPPTNVAKLARSIRPVHWTQEENAIPQIVYYQSGIGTQTDTDLTKNIDGATGRGISERVRSAYGFISNNYEPEDEIFVVGFSRGAFTARVITSLINDVGLLTPDGMGYYYAIFNAWEKHNQGLKYEASGVPMKSEAGSPAKNWEELQSKLLQTKLTRRNIPVKVCAVWDTVGSLGMPIAGHLLGQLGLNPIDKNPSPYSFVDTKIADCILHGFHAIALDEHRPHFAPTVWEQNPSRPRARSGTGYTLKQCWFTGYHTSVGGGNSDNNMLSNVSLAWMMAQLHPFLDFDPTIIRTGPRDVELAATLKLQGEPDPYDQPQDSKKGWYILDGLGDQGRRTPGQYVQTNPTTLAPFKPRKPLVGTNERIHASVRRRFWGKEFIPGLKPHYYSEALKYRTPTPDPKSTEGLARWVYQPHPEVSDLMDGVRRKLGLGDIPGEKIFATHGQPLEDILEEELTDYEVAIYKLWDANFKSIEDFDLTHKTH